MKVFLCLLLLSLHVHADSDKNNANEKCQGKGNINCDSEDEDDKDKDTNEDKDEDENEDHDDNGRSENDWTYANDDDANTCYKSDKDPKKKGSGATGFILSVPHHIAETQALISIRYVQNKSKGCTSSSNACYNGNHYGAKNNDGNGFCTLPYCSNDTTHGNHGKRGYHKESDDGNDDDEGNSSLYCTPANKNQTVDFSFRYAYVNPGSGTLPVRIIGNTSGAAEQTLSTTVSTTVKVALDANGAAQGLYLKYADVGSVTLYASATVNGQTSSASSTFIVKPDHLSVTPNDAIPRLGASPAQTSIYSGQSSSLTIKAKNASDDITPNYSGSYAKNVTIIDATSPDIATPSSNLISGLSVSANSFSAGIASPVDKISYTFPNIKTSPTQALLRATDADGVSSQGYEDRLWVRSGRVSLSAAQGMAKSALTMSARLEYWQDNINGWLPNLDDRYSPIDIAPSALSYYTNTFNNTGLIAGSNAYAQNGLATPGYYYFSLQAPGNPNAGFVSVTAQVPGYLKYPWNGATLSSPNAIAQFIDDGTGASASGNTPSRNCPSNGGPCIYQNVDVYYSGASSNKTKNSRIIGQQDLR